MTRITNYGEFMVKVNEHGTFVQVINGEGEVVFFQTENAYQFLDDIEAAEEKGLEPEQIADLIIEPYF